MMEEKMDQSMKKENETIKIFCYICLLCINIFAVTGNNSAYATTAKISDFAGVWEGSGTYVSETENHSEPLTVNLSVSGELLTGFYSYLSPCKPDLRDCYIKIRTIPYLTSNNS